MRAYPLVMLGARRAGFEMAIAYGLHVMPVWICISMPRRIRSDK